mgnify:CR=1 FL=1|jgi:hypothetical protein
MKIAFLFLTIDDIYFPKIWDYYFKNNNDKISIYCHPKNPDNIKTPWLKKNIIKNLTKTKWGHFTNAIINLLKIALTDKNNQKFIIVSESCLPIKTFETFYNMLQNDSINTSYIKLRPFEQFNFDKYNISNKNLIKHSGWWCLSRHHVKKIINNESLHKFQHIIAGDEHFLSFLYPSDNIKNFEITYANWTANVNEINNINNQLKKLYELKESENISKYDNQIMKLRIKKSILGKHPKIYDKITENELNEIKKSSAFFYRKFSQTSNINEIYTDLLNN